MANIILKETGLTVVLESKEQIFGLLKDGKQFIFVTEKHHSKHKLGFEDAENDSDDGEIAVNINQIIKVF